MIYNSSNIMHNGRSYTSPACNHQQPILDHVANECGRLLENLPQSFLYSFRRPSMLYLSPSEGLTDVFCNYLTSHRSS